MYQIQELLKFPKIFHAFSEKSDGNMANPILGNVNNFEKVLKNRKVFLNNFNIPVDSTVCMWVVHGDEIRIADFKDAGISVRDYNHAVKVDCLLTNKKGLYLFLLVADCLPIILFDYKKEVIGLAHAGWKGADLEIVKKAIKRMRDSYGSIARDLLVGLGPCARRDSFIKEKPSQIDKPEWKEFLEEVSENRFKVDFVGLCKKQLITSGVSEKNIFDCGIDTVKDQRFYSHMRENDLPISEQERFACIVGLTKSIQKV